MVLEKTKIAVFVTGITTLKMDKQVNILSGLLKSYSHCLEVLFLLLLQNFANFIFLIGFELKTRLVTDAEL